MIVYAGRPAPAPAPAAGRAGRTGRRPAPAPLFTFATARMDIPAGQTGGAELPADQRETAGPNDRPAPKRMGPAIGGFVPGQFMRIYQEGTAMKLPAGATLVFQMHYTANGSRPPIARGSPSGFAKEKPAHAAALHRAHQRRAAHPRGCRRLSRRRGDDGEPRRHGRGACCRTLMCAASGGLRRDVSRRPEDTVLPCPNYDFNWQTDYVFKEPLKLPKGTELHATAWYDNSPANKSNPDPTEGCVVGRSDLGGDDVHRHHLQCRSAACPDRPAPVMIRSDSPL